MDWPMKAFQNGTLQITHDRNCPIHNPEGRSDVPTKINACKDHLWVNEYWFRGKYIGWERDLNISQE